ncbi:MAG: oligoendopeptidase F [Chloroflexi bacterium RBG_16_47_49]|nr:MAG: oligoendopeptidase F [Chloroflexi bacterium RBG_16_47_49]
MSFTQSPWSLSDLFTTHDSPEMKAGFDELDIKVVEFEALRPDLSLQMPPQAFLDAIRLLEAISRLASRIADFAALSFSADTQDQVIQAFQSDVESRMAVIANRTLFFSLWWKSLDETAAERLMAGSGDYRYWLEEMRHFKPHTLTEPEEKVINIKDVTGARAMVNLYNTFTNRYGFRLEVDGEIKELTRGELMVFVRSYDPDLRARAYQELYRVYGQDGTILGQMYQTLARDWHNENLDMRHFKSPLAVRNLANDIPDDVVDTLLGVCQDNNPVFQRFFRLKSHWLGMERLRRYDIYAPVVKTEKKYTFDQAADLVFDAFQRFEPRLSTLAHRVLEQNHLDSEVRRGKMTGAFCATVAPDITPWVLVNYQGKPEDVATLAHELGHAIHSQLAAEHSLFTFHPSLPLAETASTFGEMVLVDHLLATESDASVRQTLLFRQVDDAYATVMRQAQFALFERQAHALVQQGATVDELSSAYLENLHSQFGDAIEVSDEFRWEWVSIPHIYNTPFYVYAYSFGQLLVLSLYQQYKLEGNTFKPRYLSLLSAGGSKSPEKILSDAGINMHSASFWQGGFDVIRGLIEQLETIPVVK